MKLYACFFHKCTPDQQHENAHKLLSFALEKEYGIDKYTLKKGSHGKPYLKENEYIKINLSHCNQLAVCAVGKCNAIGIDCESLRTVRERVIKRVCTVQEKYEIEHSDNMDLAFTRFWTLKESFVKAIGIGVSYPMKNAAFSLHKDIIYTSIENALLRQWVIQDKYVISLCTKIDEKSIYDDIKLVFVSKNILM